MPSARPRLCMARFPGLFAVAALFCLAAMQSGLQAKPASTKQGRHSQKKEASKKERTKEHKDTGKPQESDVSAESGSRTDSELSGINESWMQEIRGRQEAQPQNASDPQKASQEKSQKSPTRLRNPGQESGQPDRGLFPKQEGPSFFSVLLRFIGLMALFVGGFYLFTRYVKRKGHGAFLGAQSDLVEVLVSVPLVQGKFIQIVDVAGQLMVVGVSEAGVQLLSQITDGLTADKIRLWQSRRQAAPPSAGLLDSLTQAIRKADFAFWPVGRGEDAKESGLQFSEVLRQEDPSLAEKAPQSGAALPPEEGGVDEIVDLLHRHERRLKAMGKKRTQP